MAGDRRGLDASFHPQHFKRSRLNLLMLAGETHLGFGTWEGTFQGLAFSGLDGFAKAVHNRW